MGEFLLKKHKKSRKSFFIHFSFPSHLDVPRHSRPLRSHQELVLHVVFSQAQANSKKMVLNCMRVSPRKTKTLHLVRHGHGVHNAVGEINYDDYKLECNEDAALTELGLEQCLSLSKAAQAELKLGRIDAVLVSPMRRTLQTAQHSFPALVGQVPWLALECLREQTGQHPCDRRRPVTELSAAHSHVDFTRVLDDQDPLYWQYPNSREPSEHVLKRCQELIDLVMSNADLTEVVIVTHSAYLRHLLSILLPGEPPAEFHNCEMRSFVLACTE